MKTPAKSTTPGITVRFPAPIRDRVIRLAQVEHRSAAAYIEQLVERDLRAREEADRVVHIHVAAGLTEVPSGQVTREEGETTERFGRREAVLNALFGGR
jgi:predicted transcriptional regulator